MLNKLESGLHYQVKNVYNIEADSVVLATGLRAKKEVAEQFKDLAPEVYVIGDCVEARKIYHAFEDAWRAVLLI